VGVSRLTASSGPSVKIDPLSIVDQRAFLAQRISELAGFLGATTGPGIKSVTLQEKTFEQRSGFAMDKPREPTHLAA